MENQVLRQNLADCVGHLDMVGIENGWVVRDAGHHLGL